MMSPSWMPKTLQGRALAIGALAAVILFFAWLFAPTRVPVDVAAVDVGPLETTVDEEGVARIRETYVVSAPVSGRTQRATLEVGDRVAAGKTVVVRIMPSAPAFLDERARKAAQARVLAAEAALKHSLASVDKAEAELQFAQEELGRAEALVRNRTVSERARDQAQLQYRTLAAALATTKAEVEVKRQELDSARAELIEPASNGVDGDLSCCVTVKSPITGRVLRVVIESAQVVSAGTPLIELGDPADLELVVDLLSSDAVRIKEGDRAYVDRWGGADVLGAVVRRIEPSGFEDVSALGIEEQRVRVRLDLDGPAERYARLGHDYRVFVRIVVWREEKALRVPISALFRAGADWAAFVETDGTARLQRIQLGQRNSSHAQVSAGLAEGDRVILHPSDRVADGALVEARKVE